MKKLVMAVWLAALTGGAAAPAVQEPPAMPKPQKEHEWLQQLVGEWDTEGELLVEPGKPPIKSKGSETVRAVGGFWVIAENKGEFMGTAFTGVLTLGYNPEKKKYVGTWVDSMTNYLWNYLGMVDESGKILTLETEGPGPEPGKLTKFKEVIEVKTKDHKVFTSSMEKDGKWTTFVTMNYRRKK